MASEQEENVAHPRHVYKCLECGKNFPAYAKLVNHRRVHSGEKPFICCICSKAFKQDAHLKRHQKVHTNQRPHKCGDCKRAFKHNSHLKRHIKSHHSPKVGETGDSDPSAPKKSKNESDELVNGKHEGKQAEDMRFKCDVCGEAFSELQELAIHRRTHDNEETSYKCPTCDEDLGSQYYLKCHLRTHSNRKSFICDICGSRFKNASSLTTHEKVHSAKNAHTCEFCRKVFIRESDLDVHRRTHTGVRPYECDICGKAFKQKAHAVKHRETVHARDKTKNISAGSHEGNRNTKLRSKPGVKLNEIKICGETLITDGKFATENGTHLKDLYDLNGLTPVKIGAKPKKRLEATPLNVSSLNPNTCETCGKSYTQKSYLAVHKRIHTGEMPFECDICNKTFRQRSHLKKHKTTIHSVGKISTHDNHETSLNADTPAENMGDKIGDSCPSTETPNEQEAHGDSIDEIENHVPNKRAHTVTSKTMPQDEHLVFEVQNCFDEDQREPKRKGFKCDVCHKKFSHKGYLSVHKRIHSGERPYKCNICNRAFRQKAHVVKHKRTIHKVFKKNTLEREGTVTQSEPLKNLEHGTENGHVETLDGHTEKTSAGEIYASEYSMADHRENFERYHTRSTSSGTEDLDNCDQSNSTCKPLNASIDKPHLCEICGKAFKRKQYLAIHKRMHTGERPYKCMICNQSFRQDCHLRVHMAKVHPDDYPVMRSRFQPLYKCRFCDKVYKRMHLLTLHEKNHDFEEFVEPPETLPELAINDSEEKPFKCPYCPKSFKLKQYLTSHERVHTGVRPYVCDMCGRAFKQSSHLTRHKKRHPTENQLSTRSASEPDDKPHKCRACDKAFKSRKGLLCHISQCNSTAKKIKARKGDSCGKKEKKAHQCKECGKQFDRKQILVVHLRVHSGDRPYKCEECGKGFPIAGNLQRHKLIHSGLKPYLCKICGKAFTQKSNMEAHQRLVHKVKTKARFRKYRPKENRKLTEKSRHSNDVIVELDENGEEYITDAHGHDNEMSKCTVNGDVEHVVSGKEAKDSNGGAYLCCECGRGFDLFSSMMKHCVEAH